MDSGKSGRSTGGGGGGPPGLVRDRLTLLLADTATYRVGLVVAPAGSGKSTLLAQMAAAHPGPVAWAEPAEPVPRSEPALIGWLWTAIGPAVAGRDGAPKTIEELVRAVGRAGPPLLVVADDLHLIEGSEAEAALGRLVARLPSTLRLLLASRINVGFDLSRLRVSGYLIEITREDLRFRTWEVEQLFGDIYGEPLPPEDAAALTRRTGGWAAYLQLFHLATVRKAPAARRQVLASLDTRSRLVQDYLTHHVLADLSEELADFLVRTSVLRRPTGPMCDELLGRRASSDLLAELERRQVMTDRVDAAADTYRYHAVLLSYLDGRLVETVGVEGARREHQRAAALLEREGFSEDAVSAYARAEDWDGVARLLGHGHSEVTAFGGAWLDALPAATVASDPWMLMAVARRALASGSLAEASQALHDAAAVAGSSAVAARCRRDRAQVSPWLSGDLAIGADWLSVLRGATQRDPAAARRRAAALPGAAGRFSEGMSALLSGDVWIAARILRGVAAHADATSAMAAGAQVAALVAEGIGGRAPRPHVLSRLRDEVDAADIPWLDRLIRALLDVTGPGRLDGLQALARACRDDGDRWGEAVMTLFAGAGGLVAGIPGAVAFEEAAEAFGALGAGVLQAWAEAYRALALLRADEADLAGRAAHQARTLSGLRDVPGAAGVAALVLGAVLGDDHHAAWAEPVLESLGLWESHQALARVTSPATAGGLVGVERPEPPMRSARDPRSPLGEEATPTRLCCLGGFALVIAGQPVDEAGAKPMERTALHVLAMQAGEAVHREQLVEMLWPGADPDAGRHRLQVAISALRRLVEPDVGGRPRYLLRDGDSYRLVLGDGALVDVWELRDNVRAAARARGAGDTDGEAAALASAVAAYGGPLLPGDGPADWVVGPRATAQATAAGAAARLATLRLESGDAAGAGDAARIGLEIDRFRDDLWKLSIAAAEQADHHAEAGRLRVAYRGVLSELGVNAPGD